MKILFTTSTLPRFEGDGQSPFVLEQAIAWKKEKPNDEVYILAPDDLRAKKEETLHGVHIIRYQYFWPRNFQALPYPALLPNIKRNPFLIFQLPLFLLFQFIALVQSNIRLDIDLVYAHWTVPQGIVAYITFLITKKRYVIHNHSSDLRILTKIPFVGNFLARKIIQNSKMFFCVNSKLREEALGLFSTEERKGVENKVVVMTMGVSTQNSNDKIQIHNSNSKSKITNETFDIGFIGRLTEKKGVQYFIEALQFVDQKVTVAIAGEGTLKNNLQFLILNSKLKHQIDFLGQVSGKEKADFFRRTKAIVVPSLSTNDDVEGMPVALLEALLAGKIVVASRATNIELLPEWEQIKRAVFILPNATNTNEFGTILASVLVLSENEVLKRTNGVSKILEHYRWEVLIKSYINILEIR